ncbi:MAG TPA: hypothetical protein VFD33_04735 [Bacillota bacterium]|nr:hypothetical protein [Bacillota bacterium]
MNAKRLKKMMSEFSQEIGIEPKRMDDLGKKLTWAAAGVIGFSVIKGILRRK